MRHSHRHHQHERDGRDPQRRGPMGPEFGGFGGGGPSGIGGIGGGGFGGGPGGPGGPGGFGGGGFGGGPGGFGGRGPRGMGGRRRRGDVRLGVLLLLQADGPANGYQLIQGLSVKSEGNWTPSPGSVYPTLSVLADEGLISGTQRDGDSGTTYELTDQGREYIAGLGEIKAPWEPGPDKDHPAFGFRRAVGSLVKAASQVVQDGDPDKITKANEILSQARRDLYRLLAEDDA